MKLKRSRLIHLGNTAENSPYMSSSRSQLGNRAHSEEDLSIYALCTWTDACPLVRPSFFTFYFFFMLLFYIKWVKRDNGAGGAGGGGGFSPQFFLKKNDLKKSLYSPL